MKQDGNILTRTRREKDGKVDVLPQIEAYDQSIIAKNTLVKQLCQKCYYTCLRDGYLRIDQLCLKLMDDH